MCLLLRFTPPLARNMLKTRHTEHFSWFLKSLFSRQLPCIVSKMCFIFIRFFEHDRTRKMPVLKRRTIQMMLFCVFFFIFQIYHYPEVSVVHFVNRSQ